MDTSANALWTGLCLLLALLLSACGGGGASQGTAAAGSAQYTVGGTVSALTGTGLVLQDSTGETLSIAANGSFNFRTTLTSGSAYYVIAASQPSGPTQTCAISHSTGTIGGGNVTDVSVVCANKTDTTIDTIGVTLAGVIGSGLVLQNNGSDNLTVTTNGTVTFALSVPNGSAYDVSVLSPPIDPYEDCVVSNASGTTVGSDVANIVVSCTVNNNPKHSISGTITGVSGSIVLQNNGRDDVTVTADGTFQFPLKIPQGSVYSVSTKSADGVQSQTCQFQNASGVVGDHDVTDVVLSCNANISLQANVGGLSGSGLVLQNNASDNLPVNANGVSRFPTGLALGQAYAVTVVTQPTNPSQTCSIGNGTGTAAPGSSVTVTCVTDQFVVGGIVTGLPDPTPGAIIDLVLQDNSADDLTVSVTNPPVNAAGFITFNFPVKIASGSGYSVTVKTQPGADTLFGPPGVTQTSSICLVTAGVGTVTSTDVSNIVVTCVRPSGFAYVTNGTDNTVSTYIVDETSGLLLPSGPAVASGTAPVAATAADLKSYLYVANAGSGNVSAYDINANTGLLTQPTGSPFSLGLTSPGAVALNLFGNGPVLYVTDAPTPTGPGTISAYGVGSSAGLLTSLGQLPTGAGPSALFSYQGRAPSFTNYVVTANSAGNSMSLFSADGTTGALTTVQSTVTTGGAPRSMAHFRETDPTTGLTFEYVYVANSADGTITAHAVSATDGTLAQPGVVTNVGPGIKSLAQTANLYATAAAGVSGFTYVDDGTLVIIQGSPFVAGAGPGPSAAFLGNVYVVNQTDETITLFSVGTGGNLVAAAPNTPMKTGHGPTSIVIVQRPHFGGG